MPVTPSEASPVESESRHLDLPRGFHDVEPDRMALYRAIQEKWFHTCALAGYQAVQIPPVGFAATFTNGHNAAGERFYQFADRRGRKLALVSDSLPAILRLANHRGLPEQRLSYCCPVFRYERRSRRHFHHLGLMEVRRHPDSLAAQYRSTVRIAQVVLDFLAARSQVTFSVTDLGIWHEAIGQFLPIERVTAYLNLLRRTTPEERPARLHADGAPPELIYLAEYAATDRTLLSLQDSPQAARILTEAVAKRIAGCHDLAWQLRRQGADVDVNMGELHASEFHDGPAFMIRQGHEQLLGDGGSYGAFARNFLRAPASVHAAVLGLERLADGYAEAGQPSPVPADLAILAAPDDATSAHADRLTASLRSAGIAVWDTLLTRPLKQHLRDLAALEIPHSVIIGTHELTASEYRIRDRTGTLHAVATDALRQWIIDRRHHKDSGTDDHMPT